MAIAEKVERAVRADPVIQLNRYVTKLEDALGKAIDLMVSVDPHEGDNWKQYRDAINEGRNLLGQTYDGRIVGPAVRQSAQEGK
jgi:hypothetical protein